jgi:hypothetical protein
MRLSILTLHLLVRMVSSSLSYDIALRTSSFSSAYRKILSKARRLEDGENENAGGEQNGAEMEAFLMDYSMKFLKCIPDQVLTDADYNEHFGVVIFRLCPSNQCSDDSGCNSGYADFAVDVGTYVQAFMNDQQDNMNWDDKFDGQKFGECVEYEDDESGETGYFIGPGCTADGKGVRMAVFEDKYCYQVSETSFGTISNGWGLPYSNGGLISTQCTSCVDNDGDMREMCLDLYELSPYRCEGDFDFDHYYYDTNFEMYRYGKDQTGCSKIQVMQAAKQVIKGAVWQDLILSVMLLITAAAGFALYSVWWRKRTLILMLLGVGAEVNLRCLFFSQTTTEKKNLEKIEDEDDDDDEGGYHQHDDDGGGAHDDDHNDGDIVQHSDEGYKGVVGSNAQGMLA